MPNSLPAQTEGLYDHYFAQSSRLLRELPNYSAEYLRQAGLPFTDPGMARAAVLEYIGRQSVAEEVAHICGVYFHTFSLPGGSVLDTAVRGDRGRIDLIDIPVRLRGNGLGARLMRAGMAQLHDQGVMHVSSRALTSAGLHLRAKVFGPHGSVYYGPYDKTTPIGWDEAVRSSDFGEPPSAYIHLGGVALHDWERPVQR